MRNSSNQRHRARTAIKSRVAAAEKRLRKSKNDHEAVRAALFVRAVRKTAFMTAK
jgi:hypothetical protein